MQQAFPGADVRLDLVLGVAEHLLPLRRVHDRAGLEVPVPDAFLRAGEGQREPLLALAQRRLGALALGQVEVRADDPHDRSAGFAADRAARATARARSVRPCGGGGTRPRRSLPPRATVSFSAYGARLVVGMKQPLPRADVRLDLVVARSRASPSSATSTRRRRSRGSSPRRLPARRRTRA